MHVSSSMMYVNMLSVLSVFILNLSTFKHPDPISPRFMYMWALWKAIFKSLIVLRMFHACHITYMYMYSMLGKCPKSMHIIYFLSFERSELEGKYYSLIVSVLCMHALCLGDSCLLSQRRRWVVCLCCMHGWFGSAGGYLKWMLWAVVTLGDSYSQFRAVFPKYVHGCYNISVHLLAHVCFVWVSYAAQRQLADGTEIYLTRLDLQSNGQNSPLFYYQGCCNSFSFRAFPLSQFFLNQRFFMCERFFPMGIVGRIP